VPEAFLDKNEDGVYTRYACETGTVTDSAQCQAGSEEIFVDFNSNGAYDLNEDPKVYNGLLCPPEGDGVWCSRTLVNVRASSRLILSDDPEWDILVASSSGSVVGNGASIVAGTTYRAHIADLYNNAPTAGSTVTVTGEDGCSINESFVVPNTAKQGGFGVSFLESGVGLTSGKIVITLTPSGGTPYSETWLCQPQSEPDPDAPDDDLVVGGG